MIMSLIRKGLSFTGGNLMAVHFQGGKQIRLVVDGIFWIGLF